MEGDEEKSGDFYAVLGLKKECSMAELRNAYKKLAMKWHPDKCPASGNKIRMDKAKEKFQEIQKAYSVLSDSNKRILYDVGVYDEDDEEDEDGMGAFIGEIAQMMSQTKPRGSGHESLEELHRLFVEMYLDDLYAGDRFSSASPGASFCDGRDDDGGNKRGNSAVDSSKEKLNELGPGAGGFCFGSNDAGQSSKGRRSSSSKRRNGRKQKTPIKHDHPSHNDNVSA
ncbi:hypothetical protein OPV22_026621 [Ensete ventricosum]|uniref:J domain-containing protein n=1 Tax=Ensete ventricosum TaxID=4639 RepID=A0AAV8QH65_ENSVE|nr:hypothetical protein OPV22_026621 [Ensete ventricosum]